nr:DNA ligase 1-like [Coffea arabica]
MVRIRGGSVSAGRTFKLHDEEDEDVQIIEPSIKSPKKKTENRNEKTKQSARKKQNAQTRKPSVEPSDEQIEEHQFEGHPVSGNEEELEQPTNADVTTMKSLKKEKKTAKRKSIAQPKRRQTTDPSGKHGKRKRPEHEQPETQTAIEATPLPKFINNEARERRSTSMYTSSNLEVISLLDDLKQYILLLEDGLMMTMTSEQQATFVAKKNLLVPLIPPENENTHRKESRTESTTETTPKYRASNSQPHDKEKTPATEEETEEDDDDEDEDSEEEDSTQFRLVRKRSGSSKITI